MSQISDGLLEQIRSRFAQIDQCPEQGERIFSENAGGALTLNLVLGSSTRYAAIHGTGNLSGLAEMRKVTILGGVDNPAREGLVSLRVEGVASADVVSRLNEQGIRTHLHKADHYSGNVLRPLGYDACVRVLMCHYNSIGEVARFLAVMKEIAA